MWRALPAHASRALVRYERLRRLWSDPALAAARRPSGDDPHPALPQRGRERCLLPDRSRDWRLGTLDDLFEVAVEDVLLAVGEVQEFFPRPGERGLRQVVAELRQAELKRVPPRPGRKHDPALAHPHVLEIGRAHV